MFWFLSRLDMLGICIVLFLILSSLWFDKLCRILEKCFWVMFSREVMIFLLIVSLNLVVFELIVLFESFVIK